MFKCSTPGTIMRIWRFQCFRFNRLHTFVAIAMNRARSTCVRHFCVSVYQRRMCSIIKFIVNRNRIVVVFLQFFFRVSLQHFISFICIRKIQLRVKKVRYYAWSNTKMNWLCFVVGGGQTPITKLRIAVNIAARWGSMNLWISDEYIVDVLLFCVYPLQI